MGMGFDGWVRVIQTVGGLVESGRPRAPRQADEGAGSGGPLGQLEARLAGVVVAALKEAFDRDRARLDLERAQLDAERERAEKALEAELRRQTAERLLGQVRLLAIMAGGVWMLSAALGVWLPNIRGMVPIGLMSSGWVLAIGALGAAFTGWRHAIDPGGAAKPQAERAALAALWLLLGSIVLVGAALLTAL